MADGAVNFFLDAVDDVLLPDGVPEFSGGQFSNWRANLLKPNQSSQLTNADVDKLGKVRTRRGTIRVGPAHGTAGAMTGTLIQGLTSYQTKDYNYIVACNGAKIWAFNGATWDQIAKGGVADNEPILIFRTGLINNAGGYVAGTTALTVNNVGGGGAGNTVVAGEKLYFINNIKNDYYEYTIASVNVGAPTITITLEEPGLVFDVKDQWAFVVARPAAINNAAGYPAAHVGAMTIDGYVGVVNVGEIFVIKSENINHIVTAAGGGPPTTSITAAGTPLQSNWAASSSTVPVVFAQGNDSLYFCDGVGSIYGWNGKTNPSGGGGLMNLSSQSVLDYISGVGSYFTGTRTLPPTACKILLWFQNRLIASGIAAEPDAIYFSDAFDPTSWDHDYQKIRIGGGESDPITGLFAWTDFNLLVFKKNSIYVINLNPAQNPTPDDPTLLVASFTVKQIHKRIGCPAPMSAVQVGGGSTTPGSDVFFLDGDKKVRSIRRVLAAETQQEVGDAISLPLQDVLDRTNIAAINTINTCVATYHNDHYILAFPRDSVAKPDAIVAYNLLTQSWCGEWNGWWPTCFAMRTDLGDYSRMIFGQWEGSTGVGGTVFQWLDDLSLTDETTTTYQDNGVDIGTQLLTRAITFGEFYSFKTGLNVEFEFDESFATELTVQVILDKVVQGELIAVPFSTLSELPLRLPVVIPFTLPDSPTLLRMAFDLQRYGTWRELQFRLSTAAGKLSLRSIRVTGWIDTLQLQTIPAYATPVTEVVVTGEPSNPNEAVTGDDTTVVVVGP